VAELHFSMRRRRADGLRSKVRCIYNGASLVRAVTNYGIQYGRHNSLLGHNLLFCAQLYNCSTQDIISSSVNRLVNKYTSKLVEDYQL